MYIGKEGKSEVGKDEAIFKKEKEYERKDRRTTG